MTQSDTTPLHIPDDDPTLPDLSGPRSGQAIGIDVGGTGVKAALVDLATGELRSSRIREKTPQPATPDAVIDTIVSVLGKVGAEAAFGPETPAGCGLPGVVKRGRLMTAANIDKGWIDFPAEEQLTERLGRRVLALNDADAAGIGELAYGAAAGHGGTVLLLALGTGIGSALFIDGHLMPNTELGHMEWRGKDAETRLSGAARERRKISWKRWATEFSEYIAQIEAYLWPDLIILGGGVSKELDKYRPYLRSRAPVVPAALLNVAGIAGAALAGGSATDRTSIRATSSTGDGTRPESAQVSAPDSVESVETTPTATPL